MDLKDKKYLGEDAKTYWYYAGKRDLIQRILDGLNLKDDSNLLIVGCGLGYEIKLISKYGCVTALDSNEEALRYIPEGCKKVNARIEEITFDREYDLVLIFDVLEHIKNESLALNIVHKSLKEGGVLIIGVPSYPLLFGPHDIYVEHYRRYNLKKLKKLLEDAGFKNIKLSYWNSLLCPIIILQKIVYKITQGDKPINGLTRLPKIINNLLTQVIKIENKIRETIRFPFGITLVGTAEKKTKGDL